MKILFIGDDLESHGGIATFAKNMQLIFEDEISFISTDRQNERYIGNYTVFKLPKIFIKVPFIKTMTIRKIAKIYNPDQVILNFPKHAFAFKKSNRKIFIPAHRTFDAWYKKFSYLNKSKRLIKHINKNEFTIIASCPQEEKLAKECFNSVSYIRHMTPVIENQTVKTNKVLMLARMENITKRFDLAIEIMKNNPNFILDIYGTGSDFEFVSKLSEEAHNVNMMGYVSDVHKIIKDYSYYLCTSDYEGYPLSLVEVKSHGVIPLVRPTFAAYEDIIVDNKQVIKDISSFRFTTVEKDFVTLQAKSFADSMKYSHVTIKEEWLKLFNF